MRKIVVVDHSERWIARARYSKKEKNLLLEGDGYLKLGLKLSLTPPDTLDQEGTDKYKSLADTFKKQLHEHNEALKKQLDVWREGMNKSRKAAKELQQWKEDLRCQTKRSRADETHIIR